MDRRIPTLETERLIIRELIMDDLASINNVLNKSFGWESRWQNVNAGYNGLY